jgi:phage I-like protein
VKDKMIVCELPVLAVDATRQRIQVFPAAGEYVHPRTGPFTLTDDTLAEFTADLNARGNDIPIDRDHAFYKGQSAPAAGWFVSGTAEQDSAGVTAEVEWTPKAAEEVRNREYRFISPEFGFAHAGMDGRKIPEPHVAASTITNRPFFRSMQPIAAEDLPLEDEFVVADAFGEEVADTLTKISADAAAEVVAAAAAASSTGRVAFADPGYRKDSQPRYTLRSSEDVLVAWKAIRHPKVIAAYDRDQMSRIKARIKRAAKKFGVTIGADTTAGGDMDLTALAAAAGLTIADDATDDQVVEALKTLAAENTELKTKLDAAPKDSDMKTLIASAAKGEQAATELAVMKRDTAITAAVDELKITAAEKATYEGFWAIDPEGTAKLLADMQPRLPKSGFGTEAAKTAVMGADGNPLANAAGGVVTADTTAVMVDGVPMPVDEGSAQVHAAAMNLLATRGVKETDENYGDMYVTACIDAARQVGVDLSHITA